MIIREFFYNDENKSLYLKFSTEIDGDMFYRELELNYSEIELYSSEIITEEDLLNIDELFVEDIINDYLLKNDLPDEFVL